MSENNIISKEEYLERVKGAYRVINVLRENFPEYYLFTDTVNIGFPEWFPMGVFSCTICSEPIGHDQFNFSRCCGGCDTGRKKPILWQITRPVHGESEPKTIFPYERIRDEKEAIYGWMIQDCPAINVKELKEKKPPISIYELVRMYIQTSNAKNTQERVQGILDPSYNQLMRYYDTEIKRLEALLAAQKTEAKS